MLSKKLQDALNAQVNAEFWSAYLYLSMSVYFANKGQKGIANWFGVQFREEQDHAQILINYILSRGGEVLLAPIEKVDTAWESPMAAFEQTLKHERVVTGMINNLCLIADHDQDYATTNMLAWFVDEQVEEEESAKDMIDAMSAVDGNKFGLYMLDKELSTRTYTQASPLAAKAE